MVCKQVFDSFGPCAIEHCILDRDSLRQNLTQKLNVNFNIKFNIDLLVEEEIGYSVLWIG
jgi:hypothetical protein